MAEADLIGLYPVDHLALLLPRGCAFRERCARADAMCEAMPEMTAAPSGRAGHVMRCFHPLA